MFFIYFLAILLVILVAVSIVNLFLGLSIKLVTNNSIDEFKFILPSILCLIISLITFVLIYLVTINILDLNIKSSIMALVFKTVDIAPKLNSIISIDVIIVLISIMLQSLCLLTVNIDYVLITGKIRMFFKDLFKKLFKNSKNNGNLDNNKEHQEETNNNDDTNTINSNLVTVVKESELAENKEKARLGMLSSIICTLFIFSFLFFTFIVLFSLGSLLANKIV